MKPNKAKPAPTIKAKPAAVEVDKEENPLQTKFENELEQYRKAIEDMFREEGLGREASHFAALIHNMTETFILECGLVQIIEGLVRTCDSVASVKTADVKDNGLKRTLVAAAREQGIRISQAGDLARHLNSGNVSVQVSQLYQLYTETSKELSTVANLALQYDGIRVPEKLQAKVAELKEKLLVAHRNYPHLAEEFPV